jgi:large subunit ribosomal protein L4
MPILPLTNKIGKEVGTIELPDSIFGNPVNKHVIHQVVLMYRAAQRQGTASTTERGSVSGGGKKPWRQKGTGRARAGSIRSPLWQGGGVVFGPQPRDFRYDLPRKLKHVALRESLNAKYHSKQLLFLEEFKDKLSKTKEFVKIIKPFGLQGKTLALLDGCDESVHLVSRNLPRFEVQKAQDVNVYDILRNRNLLLTQQALQELLKRIEGK